MRKYRNVRYTSRGSDEEVLRHKPIFDRFKIKFVFAERGEK